MRAGRIIGIRVPGIGIRVPEIGIRVPGIGIRVSVIGIRMPIVGIRAFVTSTVRISNRSTGTDNRSKATDNRSTGTDKPRVCRACHLSDPQPKHLVACVLQVTAQCRLRPGAGCGPVPAAAQCRLRPSAAFRTARAAVLESVSAVTSVRSRGSTDGGATAERSRRHVAPSLDGGGVVSDSVVGVGMSASPLRRLPFIPTTGYPLFRLCVYYRYQFPG